MPRILKGTLTIGSLLLLIFFLTRYFALPDREKKIHPPFVVDVVKVESSSSYEKKESYLGEIYSKRSSSLGFEIGGNVEKIFVDEGAFVEKGQKIASLDVKELLAKKDEASAEVRRVYAQLELAKLTKERTSKASAMRAVSKQEEDQAGQNYLSYEAALNAAFAQQLQVNVRINKGVLTAPYNGVISKKFLCEGSVVNPGTPVVEIIDVTDLEARIGVKSREGIALGESRELSTKFGIAQGAVTAILPERSSATRNFEVICALPSPPPLLRPGDAVNMVVSKAVEARGVWLPITSLTESYRGLFGVLVAIPEEGEEGGYRLSMQEVRVIDQIDDRVYVASALKEGDLVVKDGLNRVVPGLRVVIKRDG